MKWQGKWDEYAVNLKYCEVVLNGDYIGLYALSEKIKRDGDRVDIAKLADDEIHFQRLQEDILYRLIDQMMMTLKLGTITAPDISMKNQIQMILQKNNLHTLNLSFET